METEKPILFLDSLIHPKPLVQCIRDHLKEKTITALFFAKQYVRVIVIGHTNEKIVDDAANEVQMTFFKYATRRKSIFMNCDEMKLYLQSLEQQITGGIPEETFYDWFMDLAFNSRQLTVPLDSFGDPKKEFNPGSQIITSNMWGGKLFLRYVFFATDKSMLNDLTLTPLMDKADELIRKSLRNDKQRAPSKRNPLDSRLRHECFKRDNYTCKECGATKEQKMLHADHILPVAQGGADELDNLQTLCDNCNAAKSNRKWKAGDVKKEGNDVKEEIDLKGDKKDGSMFA